LADDQEGRQDLLPAGSHLLAQQRQVAIAAISSTGWLTDANGGFAKAARTSYRCTDVGQGCRAGCGMLTAGEYERPRPLVTAAGGVERRCGGEHPVLVAVE
jgi:hypothetical protein